MSINYVLLTTRIVYCTHDVLIFKINTKMDNDL